MLDNGVYKEEYKGHTIEIDTDQTCEDPREWSNLGKMFCFNRQYDLGDKNPYSKDEFENWDEFEKRIIKDYSPLFIFPLSILDHTGLWMKIGTRWQSDYQGWDTSMVGFIFVTKEDVRKEYGAKRISDQTKEKARRVLKAEVNIYSSYINGDVYCYNVEDVDSCCGFYEYKGAIEEAKNSIDYHIEQTIKKHINKVKAYIRNHVPEIYREPCPCLEV